MDEKTLKLLESLLEMGMVYAVDILGALVILVVGWIVAGWAARLTRRSIHRVPKIDNTIAPIVANFVKEPTICAAVLSCAGRGLNR